MFFIFIGELCSICKEMVGLLVGVEDEQLLMEIVVFGSDYLNCVFYYVILVIKKSLFVEVERSCV